MLSWDVQIKVKKMLLMCDLIDKNIEKNDGGV